MAKLFLEKTVEEWLMIVPALAEIPTKAKEFIIYASTDAYDKSYPRYGVYEAIEERPIQAASFMTWALNAQLHEKDFCELVLAIIEKAKPQIEEAYEAHTEWEKLAEEKAKELENDYEAYLEWVKQSQTAHINALIEKLKEGK